MSETETLELLLRAAVSYIKVLEQNNAEMLERETTVSKRSDHRGVWIDGVAARVVQRGDKICIYESGNELYGPYAYGKDFITAATNFQAAIRNNYGN